MLKAVVLFNICFFFLNCDTFFQGFFDEQEVQKNSIYLKYIFYVKVFTVTFDLMPI